MLTLYKMHHPKADIDRKYVKRKEGGRGLVQIEAAYKAEIINIAEYLNTIYKKDQFVNIFKSQESTQTNLNTMIKTAAKITEELSQPNEKSYAKQDGIQHIKARLGESLKKKWKKKILHGQYIRNKDRQLMSEEDTFFWLSKGDLKAENESEIVAAQDQALQTKYYATKILNTETDNKCDFANNETTDHIISASPILAKEQYIKRHDRVCAQLHFNI